MIEAMKRLVSAVEEIPEEVEGWIPDELTDALLDARKAIAEAEKQERYFCERCGKRLSGGIHTCTPPVEAEKQIEEQLKMADENQRIRAELKFNTIAEAEKQEQWIETDMAYRPGGIPLDFIQHEVDSPNDWSEWVCPKPSQYFMKCCDCGLVHEMQFKVAKYAEGDECEFVEDADTQAVFRARRASPTKREWVGLSEEEIDKLKHLIDWTATWSHGRFAYEIEQLLKEKNA